MQDGTHGALVARIWRPELAGPSVVALRGDDVIDITALQREALVARLDDLYARVWGSRDPEIPEIVAWAAETALDRFWRPGTA